MINRFALSFLCIELDRNVRFGVMLSYILLTASFPLIVCQTYGCFCSASHALNDIGGDICSNCHYFTLFNSRRA